MAGPADPVELVRLRLQRTVRTFLTGSAAPPRRDVHRADPGLFGPDSVTWRVHADTSMLIGGLRGLLLQTLQPLTMAGVADHSDYRNDPLGRLQRTAAYIGVTTYGSTAEAKAIVRHIRAIHDRVTGTAPDGRPYRANDPHLLGWVHATEVDSFLGAYQRYGTHPLSAAEQDQYVAEMATLGRMVGVRAAPTSTAALQATLEAYRPELRAGRQAREAVRFLLVPPFPLAARPLYGVIAGAAVSLLPAYARRLLWIPLAPGTEPILVRPAATALVRLLGWALAPPNPPVAVSA
jgi:uncharacterized protein (DUF2236 family)